MAPRTPLCASPIRELRKLAEVACQPLPHSSCARLQCSAPGSWARRSPRTSSTPTFPPFSTSCRRRRAIPTATLLKAIDNLKKLEPSPLCESRRKRATIEAANYDQHLDRLKECDSSSKRSPSASTGRRISIGRSRRTSASTRSSRAIPRVSRSTSSRKPSRRVCVTGSAAFTSSIRRATCISSS